MNSDTKSMHEKAVSTLQDLSSTLSKVTSSSNNKNREGESETYEAISIKYHISHWRRIPENVSSAYQMMEDGANLIHATSTRYTLITKIKAEDGVDLLEELLKGAQWLASGVLLLHANELGCALPLRKYAKQGVMSVFIALSALIESFRVIDSDSSTTTHAQKTGVVWEACDNIKKLPKGNRSCVRRDILQYCREAKDTCDEFEEMLLLGPLTEQQQQDDDTNDEEEDMWDDFCQGTTQDQYTTDEISIVKPCLRILHCCKGTLINALKALDDIADSMLTTTPTNPSKNWVTEKKSFHSIQQLHEKSISVGNGITDLGVFLYPPLETGMTGDESLTRQLGIQTDVLVDINECIMSPFATHVNISQEVLDNSKKALRITMHQFTLALTGISNGKPLDGSNT